MTNSHPAKVKSESENILSSGVDSLVMSLYVDWQDSEFFSYLDERKAKAQETGTDNHGIIKNSAPSEGWPFTIKPHGSKGYSWILTGKDFAYKIANSQSPGTRPSVMLEIRSETLWRMGPAEALKMAQNIIEANRGKIVQAKLSRVDLCLDFLMPESLLSIDLADYIVSRATAIDPHLRNRTFTGLSIGKGDMVARLYDKALEIRLQSKKQWMYDIWGIAGAPADKKIVRIEFQIRRPALKELGLDKAEDLFSKMGKAWAYCTKDWLKFQDRPGFHHTQRSTFDWYEEIQNGLEGAQGAEPLVRIQAVCADKKKLVQMMNGCAVSLHAITMEEQGRERDESVEIDDCIVTYVDEVERNRHAIPKVQEKITLKRAKYHREASLPDGGNNRC